MKESISRCEGIGDPVGSRRTIRSKVSGEERGVEGKVYVISLIVKALLGMNGGLPVDCHAISFVTFAKRLTYHSYRNMQWIL